MLKYFFTSLVIFSFISGQLIRLDIFGNFVPLLDASVLLFIAYNILTKNFSLKKYFSQKYLLLFLGALVFSNLINFSRYSLGENITGNLYLLRFIVYSLLLGVDFSALKGFRGVTTDKIVNAIGLIIAFTGIIQYVFIPDFGEIKYQGWDEHFHRLAFPFMDTSFTGAILLVLAIYLICSQGRKLFTKLNLTIMIVEFLAIFLTFSRSAWVIGTIIVMFFFISSKVRIKKMFWVVGGICVVTSISALFIFSKSFGSYGNDIWRTETINSRWQSVKDGVETWKENPIFGVGFNNYKSYQLTKISNNLLRQKFEESHGLSSVENSFIFLLSTGGLFTFVIFLIWLKNIYDKINLKCYRYIFVSILIGSLFNNLFFYPHILLIIFGLASLCKEKYI